MEQGQALGQGGRQRQGKARRARGSKGLPSWQQFTYEALSPVMILLRCFLLTCLCVRLIHERAQQ